MTASTHPLFGELLEASGFKTLERCAAARGHVAGRQSGNDARGRDRHLRDRSGRSPTCLVLDGAGLQELHALVTTLRQRRVREEEANRFDLSLFAPTISGR